MDSQWASVLTSVLALAVSLLSLAVAITAHRSGGARIRIQAHELIAANGEHWLQVRLVNSGRSEITIEGAWSDWLGPSNTAFPIRILGGSSVLLVFRGHLPPKQYFGGSCTVTVGLGDGRTLLKRLALDEAEQAILNADPLTRPSSSQTSANLTPQFTLPVEDV